MASNNLKVAEVNLSLAVSSLDREIADTERSALTDTFIADLRSIKGNILACTNSLKKIRESRG